MLEALSLVFGELPSVLIEGRDRHDTGGKLGSIGYVTGRRRLRVHSQDPMQTMQQRRNAAARLQCCIKNATSQHLNAQVRKYDFRVSFSG